MSTQAIRNDDTHLTEQEQAVLQAAYALQSQQSMSFNRIGPMWFHGPEVVGALFALRLNWREAPKLDVENGLARVLRGLVSMGYVECSTGRVCQGGEWTWYLPDGQCVVLKHTLLKATIRGEVRRGNGQVVSSQFTDDAVRVDGFVNGDRVCHHEYGGRVAFTEAMRFRLTQAGFLEARRLATKKKPRGGIAPSTIPNRRGRKPVYDRDEDQRIVNMWDNGQWSSQDALERAEHKPEGWLRLAIDRVHKREARARRR